MVLNSHFDYIIIGNGLAGFQLALALAEDPYFDTKQIALIDKDDKTHNDKTWSFWERGSGKWDNIVNHVWTKALFYSSNKKCELDLKPYTYKSIHAIDFYNEAKRQLAAQSNIHFILEEVLSVEDCGNPVVRTETRELTSNHVFDSRIAPEFYSEMDNYTGVIQHFKGWIIETDSPTFNTEEFTMMDYRLKDGNQTTFTYVLPFSQTKALVEFTYFTPHAVVELVYDHYIERYIKEVLKLSNYRISETEKGSIPMTNFPFQQYSTKNITKIGTAGGWVKGSTGYSFKHTEKKVAKILLNLKQNKPPSKDLFKTKYAFYDKIFLKVLHDENAKGEWIFEQFYTKNSAESMFKFLDETSSLKEELQIMGSLFSTAFIKAFFKTL
ncbi:lycopene cyclase family protein [Lacinutrix neustonica]|uniref:Lycopene cyclase family protein n=1 Tax=Lacinutrix neustonica TaxID=2980107 RepID=A0A9E8MW19_9FLAO|nr:lycopene cyclase family protein [Lacinutrix neustonica]WAC02005.1 lycopene cyclase family protein [Lacinutrix neustonica]